MSERNDFRIGQGFQINERLEKSVIQPKRVKRAEDVRAK